MYDKKTCRYVIDPDEANAVIKLLESVDFNKKRLDYMKETINNPESCYEGRILVEAEYIDDIFYHPETLSDWVKKYPKGHKNSVSEYWGAINFLQRNDELISGND